MNAEMETQRSYVVGGAISSLRRGRLRARRLGLMVAFLAAASLPAATGALGVAAPAARAVVAGQAGADSLREATPPTGSAPLAHATRQAASATVTGVVVNGPLIPNDPGVGVAWPPLKAVVWAYRHGETTPLRTLHTGADGRFSVTLPPGRYRFSAQPEGVSTMPICHVVNLRLHARDTAHVRLWLDSGLRFSPIAGVTPGTAPGGHFRYRQGLEGSTRRGPIAPVASPDEPNDEACAATLDVYHLNGSPAAAVHSSAVEGFVAALPAGRYVVDPHSAASSFDRAAPFSIDVPRETWLSFTITFDTGIR